MFDRFYQKRVNYRGKKGNGNKKTKTKEFVTTRPLDLFSLSSFFRGSCMSHLLVLNDKITIIVNLQYRKGFLYWCWKEKGWKYYFILSHLM